MSIADEYKQFYTQMLELQTNFILDYYKKMFEKLNVQDFLNLYKTYCLHSTSSHIEYVYFMYNEATNLIKIGKSENPIQRLRSINTVFKTQFGLEDKIHLINLICVPSGKSLCLEKQIHEKFKNYRKNGEWFLLNKNQVFSLLNSPIIKMIFDDNLHIYYIYDEDFKQEYSFQLPSKKELYEFALDTLDNYTIEIALGNLEAALVMKKYIHSSVCNGLANKFFGVDIRTMDTPFSINTNKHSWDIFKWMYINNYILLKNENGNSILFSKENMEYVYYEEKLIDLLRTDGYYDAVTE